MSFIQNQYKFESFNCGKYTNSSTCYSILDQEVRGRFDPEAIRKAVGRKREDKYPPPPPRHFEDVRQLLGRPEWQYLSRTFDDEELFFHDVVGPEGHESLIFTSRRLLSKVHAHDTIGSDGTFRITPNLLGAEQVFLISLLAFGKVSCLFMNQDCKE